MPTSSQDGHQIAIDYFVGEHSGGTTGTSNVQFGTLKALSALDVRVLSYPPPRKVFGARRVQRVLAARRQAARTRPDAVLHVTSYWDAMQVRRAACHRACLTVFDIIPYLARYRLRSELRGDDTWSYRLGAARYIAHAGDADRIITISEWSKRDIVAFLDVPAERIDVVHPGLGDEFLPRDLPREALREFGLDPEHKYVLYVGSDQPRKNLRTLLGAMRTLARKRPDVRLIKVGREQWRGGRAATLKAARQFGVEERVHFLEHIPPGSLPRLYNLAAVVAFPSVYEGFGLPPAEGLASGVPVVTTRTTSIPEATGNAAWTIDDPYDARGLADLLDHVMEGGSDVERRKREGIMHVRRFTWESAAEKTLACYRALAAMPRR